MPSIGPLEIAIVLVILLVIFGPKKLPELGRSAGAGIRELKDSLTGSDDDDREAAPVKVEAERDNDDRESPGDDPEPSDGDPTPPDDRSRA